MSHPNDLGESNDMNFLDGNAAAGVLSEVFAVDVTSARGECAHCGNVTVMAEARVYPNDHGMVLRCSTCGDVLAMVVEQPGRVSIDLQGMIWLQLAVEDQPVHELRHHLGREPGHGPDDDRGADPMEGAASPE